MKAAALLLLSLAAAQTDIQKGSDVTTSGGVYSSVGDDIDENSPMQKVVKLMTDLKGELEGEFDGLKKAYDTFACNCKKEEDGAESRIAAANTKIDTESASADEERSNRDSSATKLKEETDEFNAQRVLEANLSEEIANKQADFDKLDTKLGFDEESIRKAIKQLQDARKNMAKSSFIQMSNHQDLKHAVLLADALGMRPAPELTAFVQGVIQGGVNEKNFHSGKIVKTLKDLKDKFVAQRKQNADDWKTEKNALEGQRSAAEQARDTAEKNAANAKDALAKAKKAIAEHKKTLTQTKAELGDDNLLLTDMVKMCEAKAKIWDQHNSARQGEVAAIDQAIKIMGGVTSKEMRRSFVQKKGSLLQMGRSAVDTVLSVEAEVGFLQVRSVSAVARRFLRALNSASVSESHREMFRAALEQEPPREKTFNPGENPFKKIKKMIVDLIDRLQDEANAEASQHYDCKKTMDEAKLKIKLASAKVKELTLAMIDASTTIDRTTEDLQSLSDKQDDLDSAQRNSDSAESADRDAYTQGLKDAKEGLAATDEAISVLKDYYGHLEDSTGAWASKQTALLQQSPAEAKLNEGNSNIEGMGGESYKGSTGRSAIFELLETVKQDFERAIKRNEANMEEDRQNTEAARRANRASNAGAEVQTTNTKEDKANAEKTLANSHTENQNQMSIVHDSMDNLKATEKMCNVQASGAQGFTDRKAAHKARQEAMQKEIDQLKKAKDILEGP